MDPSCMNDSQGDVRIAVFDEMALIVVVTSSKEP